MTYSEIHGKIKLILDKDMRVFNGSPSYTANFHDDFGLSIWELNLLLYNVEDHFNIRLENGLEQQLSTVNQLVTVIHREKQKQFLQQGAA
ncbi:MAG: hypothetical protein EA361_13865 [Bacteroidetes bacterium]|nr:MAG: hypothetical protein EA361_13865 [Bacteroidota bacterium]